MVYREIALAEFTGQRVHIAHVSAAASIDLIRAAKARGVRVTAETAPHYFTLTDEAVFGYDTNAKMNPPLREEPDRLGIIEAMAKAYISTNLANSIVFAVLIVVLLVKPAGLLGKSVTEKV